MISLKRYLDLEPESSLSKAWDERRLSDALLQALRLTLGTVGKAAAEVCASTGAPLKARLDAVGATLAAEPSSQGVEISTKEAVEAMQSWGDQTALHLQRKTVEIRELLIVLAKSAEAVGQRDKNCARQLHEVTDRLKLVAKLDDISEVRSSILRTATELKSSIDRMAEEGQAAISQLRSQVSVYQSRLEEAERVATRDSLSGLRNRHCVEGHINRRIEASTPFCLLMLDLNGFKAVNDTYGHLAGDSLLKQFASELQSASRSDDVIGRWGGDEFVLLLDCPFPQAAQRTERLRQWIDGEYTIEGRDEKIRLQVTASIGLVEWRHGETMNDIIARADADMYRHKAFAKSATK